MLFAADVLPVLPQLECLRTGKRCVPCAWCECKRVTTFLELTAQSLRPQGTGPCLTRRHFSPNGYVSCRPASSGGGAPRRLDKRGRVFHALTSLETICRRADESLAHEGDLQDEVFFGQKRVFQGVLLVLGRLMTLPFACESGPLGSCALAITDRAAC